jgi:hypothetical protein
VVKVIGFMAYILLIINTVLASTESWLEGRARNYSWETVDD